MTNGWQVYTNRSGERLTVTVNVGSEEKDKIYIKTSLSLNTWHHFALTFKSNEYMRLYLDGELKKEVKDVGEYKNFSAEPIMFLGCWSLSKEHPKWFSGFCGMLDEIKIYDEALSSEKILKHYQEFTSAA